MVKLGMTKYTPKLRIRLRIHFLIQVKLCSQKWPGNMTAGNECPHARHLRLSTSCFQSGLQTNKIVPLDFFTPKPGQLFDKWCQVPKKENQLESCLCHKYVLVSLKLGIWVGFHQKWYKKSLTIIMYQLIIAIFAFWILCLVQFFHSYHIFTQHRRKY